jgi:hypothetical protein
MAERNISLQSRKVASKRRRSELEDPPSFGRNPYVWTTAGSAIERYPHAMDEPLGRILFAETNEIHREGLVKAVRI